MMTVEQRDLLIRGYFEHTELTLEQIAEETSLSYKVVWKTVERLYTPEVRLARKQKNYRTSKIAEKNPMFGKFKEEHHNYVGEVGDGNGYVMVLKPDWFTGRKKSKHVFKHTIVMCEALGLTELPVGFVVHHIDRVTTNNNLNNLALMTNAAHTRLHQLERVTTIPQGSRA